MALHGGIHINEHLIGYWVAVRKDKAGGDQTDPVYKYEVSVEMDSPKQAWHGFVEHRYKDGAFILIQKIMEFCSTTQALPPATPNGD